MIDETTKEYFPSLRTPPSTYSRHVRYTILEFDPLLDSSSISSAGWTQIARAVQQNYALFDGFVVLHGTDSLAYTSSALSFMLSHLGKPVILTGSQASIFSLQSDAVDNLLGSLIIAGTFMIPEVCLFFHHNLYRGNRATKVSSTSFEAFASPNCEPLAHVSALGVKVNWNLVRRPRAIAKFDILANISTAHVACLRIFPGIRPEMIDSVIRLPGLRGLILETFGTGNAPSGEDNVLINIIKAAVDRGITIVNVSQCQLSGTVSPLYASGTILGQAGVIFGHDLTAEAALTKLAFLLALPELNAEDIRTQMTLSLRGEMTESTLPQFTHPATETVIISSGQTEFTALGHAITTGDYDTVCRLLDVDPTLLFTKDYADNTALHLAAIGSDVKILRELLTRGASVHVRNKAWNTPLFLAKQVGNDEFAKLLSDAGALLHIEETDTPGTGRDTVNNA